MKPSRNSIQTEWPALLWLVLAWVLVFGTPALRGQVATNPPAAIAGSTTNRIDAESRELKPGDEFSYRIEEDPVKSADPMRVVVNGISIDNPYYYYTTYYYSAYYHRDAQGKAVKN